MPAGPILERIDDFDERLDGMRAELDQLRTVVEATTVTAEEPSEVPHRTAATAAELSVTDSPVVTDDGKDVPVWTRPSREDPTEHAGPLERGPKPQPTGYGDLVETLSRPVKLPSFSVSDLFGARTLAWAGGLVTLLGVVFLFVLAADRGWIGPEERLALGGLLSIGLAGGGLYIKRRYGSLVAALSAMGVGLASGYVTLTAASATYDLLPVAIAIALASGLAGLTIWVALRWRSEILAAFAIGGAMISLPLIEQGLTPLVGTFLALMFAGAATVATLRAWRWLLTTAGAVALIEVSGVTIGAALEGVDASPWRPLAMAGAFWLLGTAAGVTYAFRNAHRNPTPFTLAFMLAAPSLATIAAILLLGGEVLSLPQQGLALLAVALGQVAAGAVVSRLGSQALGAPLWGAGLVVGAIAAGQLLDGPGLAIAWAGQTVLMGWLAIRLRDSRLQLPALVYALLVSLYAVAFEAQPRLLLDAFENPAGGVIAALVTAAALLGLGALARQWKSLAPYASDSTYLPPTGALAMIAETISHGAARISRFALGAGVVFGTYAASLGILAIGERSGLSSVDFSSSHILVTVLWALVAGAVGLATRRNAALWPELVLALGALLAKVVVFDHSQLAASDWPYSFLVAGIAIAAAGVAWSLPLRAAGRLDITSVGAMLASLGLLAAGIVNAIEHSGGGVDMRGIALLGLAAGYLALARGVRSRASDLATLATGLGLAVVAAGSVVVLDGTWLVLSWTVAAVGLVWLAVSTGSMRYQLGSQFFALLALAHVLIFEGRPDRLFVASVDPGAGAIGVLLAAIAVLAAGFALTRDIDDTETTAAGEWARELVERARNMASWLGGGLLLLAVSLGLLELFQAIGSAGVDTQFQRGHAAVSASWAIAALGLLWLGASRNLRAFRYAGFVLFAATLAKIFLYDLATLSAVARAGSFIAVGTLLLIAGAFYQRLVERDDDNEEQNGTPAPPQAGALG